ncbi:MAG TPA: hypothetical protein VN023_09600 [Methylovorus sp.]|nr:hypothetical protein [Methylovorus sp.]
MIALVKKVIHDCLTGADGATYDPARVYGAMAVNVFLVNALYALYKGQTWDPVNYGTGFGILLAGFGAAVALKSKTEPTAEDPGK